jgi:hypothetical protein
LAAVSYSSEISDPSARQQEILRLDAGLDVQALALRLRDQAAQDVAGGLRDLLALHDRVGGDPCDLGLPRQLDDRGRVGHGQHVGMGGRHVEP